MLPLWCAICDELAQLMSYKEFITSTVASDTSDPEALLDANVELYSQTFSPELLQSWRHLIAKDIVGG